MSIVRTGAGGVLGRLTGGVKRTGSIRRTGDPFTGVNPLLFLYQGNGSLAYLNRAGGGTLTGSGAVRYRAAENARWNYVPNPSAETNTTGWLASGLTLTSSSDWASQGSKSFKCVLTAVSGSSCILTSNNPLNVKYMTPGQQYTLRFDVRNPNASTKSIKYYVAGYNLTGGAGVGAISPTFVDVPAGQTVSVERTFTLTAGAEGCYVVLYAPDDGTYPFVNGDIVYFDGVMVTDGASAGSYLDGSTGGAWLDPITGILGTAHASPSVSQAVAWVEEGTTNTVPDPIFGNATITNFWTAQGAAAISKITTHAVFTNGGKVVCGASTADGIHQLATSGAAAASGQAWTGMIKVRAFAAGDVGKTVKIAVIERDAADAVVATNLGSAITLTDAWQEVSYSPTLAGGGTVAKVTIGVMNGAAAAVDFVLGAVDLVQKAYATSHCDGAIGTGYAWSGTAHASSSTRTACAVLLPESSGIVMPAASGSVFARFSRTIDNGGTCEIFNFGDYNNANKDCLQLYVSSGDALTASWRYGTVSQVTPGVAGALAVGTWYVAGVTWSGANMDLWRGTTQATPITNRLYYGDTDSVLNNIGIGCTPGGSVALDGGVGPVAIFSRPLTAAERMQLGNSTQWGWAVIAR